MGSAVGDAVAVGVAVRVGSGVAVAVGNGVAVSAGGAVGRGVAVCVGAMAPPSPSSNWPKRGAPSSANVGDSGIAVAVDAGVGVCVAVAALFEGARWTAATAADSTDGGGVVLDWVVRSESVGMTRLATPPHRKRIRTKARLPPQPVRMRLDQEFCALDGFSMS